MQSTRLTAPQKHTATEHTLESGARLLMVRTPGQNMAYFCIAINGGFRSVGKEKFNLPHLTEHMIFHGSSAYGNVEQIARLLQTNGGCYNGTTSPEDIRFNWFGGLEDLKSTCSIMIDCVFRPTLAKEIFDQEQQVVEAEIMQRFSDPGYLTSYALTQLTIPELYPNYEEQLHDLTRIAHDETTSYHKQYFTAANASIVLIGDLSDADVKRYTSLLNRELKDVHRGKKMSVKQYPLYIEEQPIVRPLSDDQANSTTYCMQFTNSAINQRTVSADLPILEALLSHGLDGIFMKRLRKEGLVYDVQGYASALPEAVTFTISGSVEDIKVRHVLRFVVSELKALKAGFIDEEAVESLKHNFIGTLRRGIESPGALAAWYEDRFVRGKPLISPEQYAEKVKAVTVESLLKIAHSIFDFNSLSVLLTGKHAEKRNAEITYYLNDALDASLDELRLISDSKAVMRDKLAGLRLSNNVSKGKSFRSGELWLVNEGLLHFPLNLKQQVNAALTPQSAAKSRYGHIDKELQNADYSCFIKASAIESYALKRGLVGGKLTVITNDGVKSEFHFMRNDMDYIVLENILSEWVKDAQQQNPS